CWGGSNLSRRPQPKPESILSRGATNDARPSAHPRCSSSRPSACLGSQDSNRGVQRKGIYRKFSRSVAGISVHWLAEILAGEEFSFLSRQRRLLSCRAETRSAMPVQRHNATGLKSLSRLY